MLWKFLVKWLVDFCYYSQIMNISRQPWPISTALYWVCKNDLLKCLPGRSFKKISTATESRSITLTIRIKPSHSDLCDLAQLIEQHTYKAGILDTNPTKDMIFFWPVVFFFLLTLNWETQLLWFFLLFSSHVLAFRLRVQVSTCHVSQ